MSTDPHGFFGKIYRTISHDTRLSIPARHLSTVMRTEPKVRERTAPIALKTIMEAMGWKNKKSVYLYLGELIDAGLVIAHPRGRMRSVIYEMTDTVRLDFKPTRKGRPSTDEDQRLSKGSVRIPAKIRAAVYRRDRHRCQECSSEDDLTIDHILAVSRGGETIEENLQTLCRKCNSRKGAR